MVAMYNPQAEEILSALISEGGHSATETLANRSRNPKATDMEGTAVGGVCFYNSYAIRL